MFIGYKEITDIIQHRNADGAVSIYIYSNFNERAQDFLTRLNSFIDTIKKEAEISNKRDLKKAIGELESKKEEIIAGVTHDKSKTISIFASPNFFKIIKVPFKLKERAVLNKCFYTAPLVSMLNQFERYAVLVFDRRRARLFSYYLGVLHEEESVFHEYVLPNFNSLIRGVSNKIIDTFHKHLKEVSDIVFNNFKHHGFDKLILGSHQNELGAIKQYLHSYLLERIKCEFVASVDDPNKLIQDQICIALSLSRKIEENNKINELINNIGKKAVIGLSEVNEALMNGNIKELVVSDDFHVSGYTCPDRHYITLAGSEGKKCDYCGKVLEKEQYLEDEITDEAFLQGSEVFSIKEEKEKFSKYKIGAFLRF